jgi:3-dehydroquinate synthase
MDNNLSLTTMTEILHVELAERSYPIYIGTDLWDIFGEVTARLRADGRRVAVIADQAVAKQQPEMLKRVLAMGEKPLLLRGGERTKSLAQLGKVYDWMAAQGLDRKSAVFAIGGGVIGDLAGFAAATYLRGITLYQVPTTLLAMVDSSVGGKTGINLRAGKNLAGAFWQPQAVMVDTAFLRTLPEREFSAGMAEVIKYGLLADADLFHQIERTPVMRWDHPGLPSLICECCAIKAGIVGNDERETQPNGGRALLNLGHTFAHAIENIAGYGEYLHGEAVGVGLVLAAKLSHKLGLLPVGDVARIEQVVKACKLPVRLRKKLAAEKLLTAMKLDKKVRGGKLRFIALRGIGQAETVDNVPEKIIRDLWRKAGAA